MRPRYKQNKTKWTDLFDAENQFDYALLLSAISQQAMDSVTLRGFAGSACVCFSYGYGMLVSCYTLYCYCQPSVERSMV